MKHNSSPFPEYDDNLAPVIDRIETAIERQLDEGVCVVTIPRFSVAIQWSIIGWLEERNYWVVMTLSSQNDDEVILTIGECVPHDFSILDRIPNPNHANMIGIFLF